MSESEQTIDWNKAVNDMDTVAQWFREIEHPGDLAALMHAYEFVMVPVLQTIPAEVWMMAYALRFQQQREEQQATDSTHKGSTH